MSSLRNPFRSLLLFVLGISAASGKSGFLSSSGRGVFRRALKIGASFTEELDGVLTEALGLGHGMTEQEQEKRKQEIQPMFESMPKSFNGRVSRDAMIYMVRRYFGHEHGWSIKGFDPASTAGNTSNGSASSALGAAVLRQKLPRYVESVLENRLEREGFALNDVVTMLVVLERMIFDEGMGMLEDAYYLREKETTEPITHNELMEVVFTYMLVYGFEAERRNRTDLGITLRKIRHSYPRGWPSGVYGLAQTKTVLHEMKQKNPFEDHSRYGFDVAQKAVARATEGYGKWSNGEECRELKETLVELDRDGSGRVRLLDFYKRQSVGNNWFFEETPEYLRVQGVLDETSPSRGSQVIISNYVQALSNCIEVSQFYSICCSRECDSVIQQIEREIRAPAAEPAEILPVVQRIMDAKAEAPRNLTTQFVAQLEDVARLHDGQVPLHGRLFNQWLHYVFPYECPYPQMRTEAVQSAVITEYSSRTGLPSVLNQEEMKKYIEENGGWKDEEAEEDETTSDLAGRKEESPIREMAQWTMEEELYVGYHHQGPRLGFRGSSAWAGLRTLSQIGILLGSFFGLKQFATTTLSSQFFLGSGGGKKADFGGGRDVFV